MSSAVAASPAAPETLARLPSRALPLFAGGVLGFMVLVILWGAVVRTTGSGAGCGDHWPLCNGDFVPRHPRLTTLIEFTHRSMSGICTALVALLGVWTFRSRAQGDRARRAVVWTGVLLLTEALLGAVLVKGHFVENNASNLRVFMQCIHFTNTMLLLGALTVTWRWLAAGSQAHARFSRLPSIAWITLTATVVVGATGSVTALADTLFPAVSLRSALLQDFAAQAPLLVRMRWLHPAAAAIALFGALLLVKSVKRGAARLLLLLIAAQVGLGVADVLLLAPTWMQMLHLLGADIYWIALVAVAFDVPTRQTPIATAAAL